MVGWTCRAAIWRATMTASSPTPFRSDDFLAEEVDADEVEAPHDGARSFLVDREAELVERAREADPGLVVGPKATREHNRTEAAQAQLVRRLRVERFRLGDLRPREAALGDQLPDQIHELRIPLIAPGDDQGDEAIRQAYGPDKYDRLKALKRHYDPDNFFRLNQNIPPD
jgi:hypothetical protein